MTDARRPWRWKVFEPGLDEQLDLLYEPGNWGDVLKGTWALAVLRALLARRGGATASGAQPTSDASASGGERAESGAALSVLDPWAGAPTWPLLEGVAERLATLGDAHPFVAAQEPFLEAGRLASTGRLLASAAEASGARLHARVFDLSSARREAWALEPHASLLPLEDGADALGADVPPSDLLLVDPYDLHETADALLPRALSRRDGALLFYLFNRSPRGAAALAGYERMRDRLSLLLARDDRRLLVGRIPSDARLPRAYHETWLVGDVELIDSLRRPLRTATHELAAHLAREGAFEEG
ncbi:MAG: hypothetical protein H6825_13850 [Planctomycetes bacterium]|nr:hypothetical protein [Planctomycetota bacterium]